VHEILTVKRFPDVDRHETCDRSFDFSKFPNLQEVTLICRVIGSTPGGLPWFPTALSTLKPATSPCLSAIRLDFSWTSNFTRFAETLIEDMGGDLRRVADEVFRIEREFEGAVNLTTHRDTKFEVAFGTLNVRFRCVGGRDLIVTVIHFCSSLVDPSAPQSLRWDPRFDHSAALSGLIIHPANSLTWMLTSQNQILHTYVVLCSVWDQIAILVLPLSQKRVVWIRPSTIPLSHLPRPRIMVFPGLG